MLGRISQALVLMYNNKASPMNQNLAVYIIKIVDNWGVFG
jgi:hypothetical protein